MFEFIVDSANAGVIVNAAATILTCSSLFSKNICLYLIIGTNTKIKFLAVLLLALDLNLVLQHGHVLSSVKKKNAHSEHPFLSDFISQIVCKRS